MVTDRYGEAAHGHHDGVRATPPLVPQTVGGDGLLVPLSPCRGLPRAPAKAIHPPWMRQPGPFTLTLVAHPTEGQI